MDDDNSCGIPYEITSNNELEYVKLGVYAYDVGENEQLIKRYSPSPIHFKIENGSYKPAKDSEIPSADIIEQFEKRIDDKLDEVDDAINTIEILNIDANKVDDKTTVEITRKDGSTKKVEILDGEKGDCYFATFSIVNAHLIMNKPQQITQFNFHLDNKGHLQMEVGV